MTLTLAISIFPAQYLTWIHDLPYWLWQTSTKKKFKRHKEFKHVYTTIIILLLLLAVMILLDLNKLQVEATVLVALLTSFVRVWFTYIIAMLVAVPLGIKIALSKRWFRPLVALLQVLSAIPGTILLPAVVVVFALLPYFGELTAFVVIFIAMVWYLLFSVISGMRTIPESLLELASISRLDWKEKWRSVYIPAALPSFITGSITAIGGAWNALILAEYFSVQSGSYSVVLSQVGTGIGKLIDIAVFSGNLDVMVLAIVSMTIMVVAINRLFWQKIYSRVTSRYKFEV